MQFDLTRYWYRKKLHIITILLMPLSFLFGLCAAIRRLLYRHNILKSHRFSIPVIVVGNIVVGGTGKTPLVIWLAEFLRAQGFKPGIVSRGVGGKAHAKPHWVTANDSARVVGDEAILLLQNSGCPVVIGVDRVAAVRELLKRSQCNIVISDDGLQHYKLARDIEIAVVDGVRRFGNQWLLPAGPLRERVSRLNTVDFIIVNGGDKQDEFSMLLEPAQMVSVSHPEKKIPFAEFPRSKVHAVAGIGNPERFFTVLKTAGFDLIPHKFPDHFQFGANHLDFTETLPILMTEKDAVKCRSFASQDYWYLHITAKINNKFENMLLSKLTSMRREHDAEKDFTVRTCDLAHDHQSECISGLRRKE